MSEEPRQENTGVGTRQSKPVFIALCLSAVFVAAFLYYMNFTRGMLNQDEGWYLYAASLINEGQTPYIDFASTQGPVMPYVYSAAQPLVDKWGVAGGRLFTAVLGIICVLLSSILAGRLAVNKRTRWFVVFCVFCLAGINVYQSYFFTIIKTYSLAGLLITAGFLVMTAGLNRRYCWFAMLLSGAFIGLAAGTRISAAFILPVVFGGLLWADMQKYEGVPRFSWLWFGLGACVLLAGEYLPFAVKAPKALWFALYEYHAGREPGNILAYKAGFISRLVQAYFICASIIALLFVSAFKKTAEPEKGQAHKLFIPFLIIVSTVLVTAVHFMAPFPYDDYQAMIFPLFAAGIVVVAEYRLSMLILRENAPRNYLLIAAAVFLVSTAAAFSSSMNEKWFIGERDKIWWPVRKEAPMKTLKRAAEIVRILAPDDKVLLTQDIYLAVETGMKVPHGLELGPFSYFPNWSREKAESCHVLNRQMFLDLIGKCEANIAAFSGYGLAIQAPEIKELPKDESFLLKKSLLERYESAECDIRNFGQADTELVIFKKKEASDEKTTK